MPEFDPLTATQEQKREAIEKMAAIFEAAGLTKMTHEEKEELLKDTERKELYILAQPVAAEIKARNELDKKKIGFNVLAPFKRTHVYLFDYKDSDEAREANKKIADRLSDQTKAGEFLKEQYDRLTAIDETSFYIESDKEQIEYLTGDTGLKLFSWELKNIYSNAPNDIKPFPLTKEQMNSLDERFPIYQTVHLYEQNMLALAHPYNLLIPKRPAEELVALNMYFQTHNMDEGVFYTDQKIPVTNFANHIKYSRTAADMLKERGFFGTSSENISYEVYNSKGKDVSSRSSGLDEIFEGSSTSVRIVKHEKVKENGVDVTHTSETTLSRDEIYNVYHAKKIDEKLEKVYPAYRNLNFSEDPRKATVQKAVIANYFPDITAKDDFFKDIKDRKIQRFIDGVLDGSDDNVKYIMSHSPEVVDMMLGDLSEKKIPSRFVSNRLDYMNSVNGLRINGARAGEIAFNAYYAPKTDSLDIPYSYNTPGLQDKMIDAQKKADEIVINAPEGFTDEDVIAANLALLLTSDKLKKNYKNMEALGQVDPNLYVASPVYESSEVILHNLLSNDGRPNTAIARLLTPEIRRETKDILENLNDENKDKLVNNAQESIRITLNSLRSHAYLSSTSTVQFLKSLKLMYNLLERPEFEGRVHFSEKELEWKKFVDVNYKINLEKAELEHKLKIAADKKKIDASYLNKPVPAKVSDDPEINEIYMDYYARVLYFQRADKAISAYFLGVSGQYGEGPEAEPFKHTREMSRVEKNCMEHPEQYIEYMKEQFKETATYKENTDYISALSKLTPTPEDGQMGFNEAYKRQWMLNGDFRDFIREVESDDRVKRKYEKLIAEIKELPCMKNREDVREVSAEEMTRLSKLYGDMSQKIKALHYERFPNEDDEMDDEGYSSKSLEDRLANVSVGLLENIKLFKDERIFETQMKVHDYYVGNKEIGAADAEKILDETEKLYKAEIDVSKCYMDHPVKEDYEKLIKRIVANAKAHNISDPEFDKTIIRIDDCFGEDGELEMMSLVDEINDIEEKLAKRMLDDDSVKLREKYAFIVNLQSNLEAYNNADTFDNTFIKAAKAPTSRYSVSYANAKKNIEKIQRVEKTLEEAAAKEYEAAGKKEIKFKQKEYKKLVSLARGSMDNIRKAIANEATGNTKEGIATLKNGEDIATLAIYNSLLSSNENSPVRALLEAKGAEYFIYRTANTELFKNKIKDVDLDKIVELLEDSHKFNEFIKQPEEAAKLSQVKAAEKEVQLQIPTV